MARAPDTLSNDPLIDRTFAGQYTIERLIGRGGMGRVYLADQRTPPAKVVVKVLSPDWADDPEAVARFEREAERLSEISHSNIVELFDYGHEAGISYIVMEYVDGELLSDYLDRTGALTPEQAVPIMAQVLKGTGYAHSRELMLRDIKPENVMLCEHKSRANFVKMLDFGLAKLVQDDANITKQNVMGTANYMAPEAIKGGDIDLRVDVYALGVLFYQMLAGHLPFTAESDTAVLYKHVNEPPPPLAEQLPNGVEVPDGLLELIHDCLAKNRDERPADANAIVERLIDCVPLSMFRLPRADGAEGTGQSLTGRITGMHDPSAVAALSGPQSPFGTGGHLPLAGAAPASGGYLPMEAPPAKSKTPLILAGVGALALVGIFMATRGSDPPPAPAEPTAAATPTKPAGPSAAELLTSAKAAYEAQDYDEALAKLDAVDKAEPNADESGRADRLRQKVEVGRLMNAAVALEKEGDRTAALAAYQEVVRRDTANAEARAAISRLEAEAPKKKASKSVDPNSGELVVVSVPIAALYVDGEKVGNTPYRGRVPAGAHELRLELDGYESRSASIDVSKGDNDPLEYTLDRIKSGSTKRPTKSTKSSSSKSSDDDGGTQAAADPTPEPETKKTTSKKTTKSSDSGPFMPTTKKKGSGVFLPVGD